MLSWSIVQLVLSTRESLECVADCCSKVKLFFPPQCSDTVLQLTLVLGGSGLNVNEVMRVNNLGSCIQMQEGLFRTTLNLILLFYGMYSFLIAALHCIFVLGVMQSLLLLPVQEECQEGYTVFVYSLMNKDCHMLGV